MRGNYYYQAITGDRSRLPLDQILSNNVTGRKERLVNPMLAINMINGQTTFASQNVKGNLFYRGLHLKNPVFLGDTLTTKTKIGWTKTKPYQKESFGLQPVWLH